MERNGNLNHKKDVQDYLMTDKEVAEFAKVSVGSVRYWRQMGVLPFVKVGRHPRIWHSVVLKVFKKPASDQDVTDSPHAK